MKPSSTSSIPTRSWRRIEKASRMLAALPEKKALIYFSAGVSKTGVDNQAQLEASINAAVKSNVAIYPIDARGLMADPPGGGASKAASRGTGIFNGSVYNSQRASINDSQETLVSLADDTGGKAFLDSNDIDSRNQAGAAGYSQLLHPRILHLQRRRGRKISPHHSQADQRHAGAKLEHRPGYWAVEGLGQDERRG